PSLVARSASAQGRTPFGRPAPSQDRPGGRDFSIHRRQARRENPINRVTAAALALLLPALALAAEDQPVFPLFPYQKQGRFVTAPAQFLATPVYQVGFMA